MRGLPGLGREGEAEAGDEAEQEELPAEHPPKQRRPALGAAARRGGDEADRRRRAQDELVGGKAEDQGLFGGELLGGKRAELEQAGQPLERGQPVMDEMIIG